MGPAKLLSRLRRGSVVNVSFDDFQRLVESSGFQLDRVAGSHHIFRHADLPERLNLQRFAGEAKPYQIRQFLRLVEKYDLRPEE
jgi:predicted RNA binding protein YcfA (HicA-like mRNA interferase family)